MSANSLKLSAINAQTIVPRPSDSVSYVLRSNIVDYSCKNQHLTYVSCALSTNHGS